MAKHSTENGPRAHYDLEERTYEFAKDVRKYCKPLLKNPLAWDDARQLIRASGSVGAIISRPMKL